MIFLVSYDRQTQTLMHEVEVFNETSRADARRRRLEIQLELPQVEGRYEVVLIEAPSRADLNETHGRYFFEPAALIEAAQKDLSEVSARLRKNGTKQSS